MGRANKLVFMLVLAAIFAYSGCSGRHNPPPGGGEQFSLTIALPADIAMPLPGWLNHLGGRAPKNRVREIIPYSNCIDIYVYNPNDPTDNTKITRNLVDEKTPIPVNCTVNSTGPYTIEVFASAVIDADLSICFTAGRATEAIPGSGPVYITLERLDYIKGPDPDTPVSVGGTLSMSGLLESPVPVSSGTIDMVYAQFTATGSDNFFHPAGVQFYKLQSWIGPVAKLQRTGSAIVRVNERHRILL